MSRGKGSEGELNPVGYRVQPTDSLNVIYATLLDIFRLLFHCYRRNHAPHRLLRALDWKLKNSKDPNRYSRSNKRDDENPRHLSHSRPMKDSALLNLWILKFWYESAVCLQSAKNNARNLRCLSSKTTHAATRLDRRSKVPPCRYSRLDARTISEHPCIHICAPHCARIRISVWPSVRTRVSAICAYMAFADSSSSSSSSYVCRAHVHVW